MGEDHKPPLVESKQVPLRSSFHFLPSWADLETLRVAAAHEGRKSSFAFLCTFALALSLLSSSSLFVVAVAVAVAVVVVVVVVFVVVFPSLLSALRLRIELQENIPVIRFSSAVRCSVPACGSTSAVALSGRCA